MPCMKEIDELIKQTKFYKQWKGDANG
jgi:hypothetical protein